MLQKKILINKPFNGARGQYTHEDGVNVGIDPKGKLDGQSFLALKELKKQCTKMYNDNFNYMGKSFDEEYMPVKFKV